MLRNAYYFLLLLGLLVHKVTPTTYFVIPDDYSSHHTDANTFSLQHYLNNTSKYFVSHNQFHFMQGQYYINNDLIIKDIDNFTITGPTIGQCNIICTSPASIVVMNVNNSEFHNISLINCINSHKDYLHTLATHFKNWYASDPIPFSKVADYFTSLLVYNNSSVIIYKMNVNVTVTTSFTGVLIMNIKDSSMVNVKVQVNIVDCTPFINHSVEICGLQVIVYFYDNMSKRSSLTIESFHYNSNKTCENSSLCVIAAKFLQNKTPEIKNRFMLQILNSVFSNLKNSSILCSYGETKEIPETGNSERTIRIKNSKFCDNTGNPQLSMFNIVLKCLASCTDLHTKMMNQQYRYAVQFSNCTFTRNSEMKILISMRPPTTRTTVGNIVMYNSTFTENKNMTFIRVKREFQTMFYKIIYIVLSCVNVTSNEHYYGDNLILITNVRLVIGNFFLNQNEYYENIIKLQSSMSLINLKHSEINSNFARYIIKASYILYTFL